ncbi:MAG: di-trans,poly-cis-decaprenylcistransferase [Gammaproteobacteria bacterium]|nr:MAG: di-trans,poly-cis-decaprenylcistransferase [Gammaproteobacteria bacterium]
MSDSLGEQSLFQANSRPRHVAIIMDGNNRWAKKNRLLGVSGHRAGVEAVRAVVETCVNEGIEVLTLFAFSSENWRRPKDEVSALMKLFLLALQREVKKLHQNGIRLRIIGDRSRFNSQLVEHMEKAEQLTRNNTVMTLVVAANYGGRWDIVNAVRKMTQRVLNGDLGLAEVNEDTFQQGLCLGELPMPDLLIRTGGEQRISNFLLWHMAYTEFYFSDCYWPDFKQEQMQAALHAYSRRQRRFGQTDDQLAEQSASHNNHN